MGRHKYLKIILGILVLIIVATMIPKLSSAPKNEAPVYSVIRKSAPQDLVSILTERTSVMRLSPLDASRFYSYTLLAGDVAYKKYDTEGAYVAAGYYTAISLFHNPLLNIEMLTYLERHGVSKQSLDYENGLKVAKSIIDLSNRDNYISKSGYSNSITLGNLSPLSKKYRWVPTGTGDGPLQPYWGVLKPLIKETSTCNVTTPTDQQVESEARSLLATWVPEQAIGRDVLWWLAGTGTATPSGFWLRMTNNALDDAKSSFKEASEVLAKVAVADFDAGIKMWEVKYNNSVGRPESVWKIINNAPVDILPRDTPNHPSYVSGHSGFSAAAAQIIKKTLGDVPLRDALPADLYADQWVSTWPNPDAAVNEASQSRVHSAFHYQMDVIEGQKLGYCVGDKVNSGFNDKIKELVANVK